ncbi:MAG: protein kinase [Alphaproteobacteria bacterium]
MDKRRLEEGLDFAAPDEPEDATRMVIDAPAAAPSDRDTIVGPGMLLSHTYRIESLLARGGMGEIYSATHAKLGTRHAIKIMLPELAKDQKVIDLFTREAAVLRNVRNEAVVGYDGVVCDEEERLYLVMEFVDGPSLSDRLNDGPLSLEEIRLLRDRLAMGLGAAHEQGVIHRDMSPDNVILPDGRLDQAKIIDFGIAKLADPEIRTVIGDEFAGKYPYASPEQLGMYGGNIDARSDIYSVALVLAAAAIGRPLDMGKTHLSVIEARRSVPDLSEVPKELRDDLEAMLQPEPDDRPQSMAELLSPEAGGVGFRTAAPTAQSRRAQTSVVAPPPQRRSSVGLISGVVAAVVVVAAGIGGYFILQGGEDAVTDGGGQTPGGGQVAGGDLTPGGGQVAGLVPTPGGGQVAGGDPTPSGNLAPGGLLPPSGNLTPGGDMTAGGGQTLGGTVTPGVGPSPGGDLTPGGSASPGTLQPPDGSQVATARPPDLALVRAEIDQILGGFQCPVSATLTDNLEVMLSGYLSGADAARRLTTALTSIYGISAVMDNTVRIHPWPFCTAINVLETQASIDPSQPGRPELLPNNPSLVYNRGDSLVVRANATGLYDGYLYVDFIIRDGTVVHLFPIPESPNNRVSAGQQVTVGGQQYVITPPFGTDMILAISAPAPLFASPRGQVEDASAYLQALSEGLTALARRGLAQPVLANYVFITSREAI